MTYPFFKPTDITTGTYMADLDRFNSEVEGVRRKSSPDITVAITEDQLPEKLITSEEYLGAAKRKVFRNAGITSINPDDDLYPDIVQMTTILLAIEFIPQVAQILQDGQLQDVTRYQEVGWKDRAEMLINQYEDIKGEINPESIDSDGDFVALTDSKVW